MMDFKELWSGTARPKTRILLKRRSIWAIIVESVHIENTFTEMKRWRVIATRRAKNAASYLAAVHFRCLMMWAKIY